MIEQMFEKLLESSSLFKEILSQLEKLFKNVSQLAETLVKLTTTVKSHQDAISELSMAYVGIISAINQDEGLNNPFLLFDKIDDSELN
jgi:hypothetical protein